jgi:hypothetical protein
MAAEQNGTSGALVRFPPPRGQCEVEFRDTVADHSGGTLLALGGLGSAPLTARESPGRLAGGRTRQSDQSRSD